MARVGMWIGLCAKDACDELRRALSSVEPGAALSFAGTAQELRHWVREAGPDVGAIVGLIEEGVADVNVAAALVRDAHAAEVILVVRGASPSLRERARRAGIQRVVDLLDLPAGKADGLDEPELIDEEVPTMVMGVGLNERRMRLESVPSVEERPVRPAGGAVSTASATSAAHRAPVIAVVSGRGGVGKTSLVATMADVASRWGMRVAACDFDLACGNLYSCFGANGPADLASEAKDGKLDVSAALASGKEVSRNIRLWGSCALPETAEVVSPLVEDLLQQLRSHCDLVLVDTSTAFDDTVAQVVQECDRLLIVVDGLPGSTVAQARLGALAVRLGVARTRIVRVSNFCGRKGRSDAGVNRADPGMETARTLRVLDGGPEVTECLAEGGVRELVDLGSRYAESVASALARLLAELGSLPNHEDARRALERKVQPSRWAFGRRREAM